MMIKYLKLFILILISTSCIVNKFYSTETRRVYTYDEIKPKYIDSINKIVLVEESRSNCHKISNDFYLYLKSTLQSEFETVLIYSEDSLDLTSKEFSSFIMNTKPNVVLLYNDCATRSINSDKVKMVHGSSIYFESRLEKYYYYSHDHDLTYSNELIIQFSSKLNDSNTESVFNNAMRESIQFISE